MSQCRKVEPGAIYLITRRTILRHKLLRPDQRMNQILKYILAIASGRYGIEVHAFCAMSTHIHLVITDVRGVLPRFLHFFHTYVARCTKALRRWDEVVWDKEPTSVVRLDTPAAVVDKIAYVLVNPVSAGLVRHAHEWPGAKVLVDEIGRGVITAPRPEVYLNPRNRTWLAEASFPVVLPSGVRCGDAFRRQVAAELARREAQAHAMLREQGRGFLGADAATRVPPESRATTPEPKIDRDPTFAVGPEQGDAWHRAAAEVRSFRAAYRSALERWKNGVRDVVFPAGTWWMRVFHGAATAPFVPLPAEG